MRNPLAENILASYIRLRNGLVLLAFFLPIILWVFGPHVHARVAWLPLGSISAYYYSSMSDVFVGILCAVGAFLIHYNGNSLNEGRVLNVAGLALICVAFFPMDAESFHSAYPDSYPNWFIHTHIMFPNAPINMYGLSMHGISAVIFFLCISVVCIHFSKSTLSFLPENLRLRYTVWYNSFGAWMIIAPIIVFLFHALQRPDHDNDVMVFFIELVGIWVFAAYWLVKSSELKISAVEHKAIRAHLSL